jgi:hypothetical protein
MTLELGSPLFVHGAGVSNQEASLLVVMQLVGFLRMLGSFPKRSSLELSGEQQARSSQTCWQFLVFGAAPDLWPSSVVTLELGSPLFVHGAGVSNQEASLLVVMQLGFLRMLGLFRIDGMSGSRVSFLKRSSLELSDGEV